MARRKESGLDLIASFPWQVGVALGIAAYLGIRYGIGWYFSTYGGSVLKEAGRQASAGSFAPLAWMAFALCWIAAGVSFLKSHRRKQLLETQTGLDSLTAMSWREFEMLVGEAFRRRGYSVEETGMGGKDGGIDLVLRKDGRTELVQCKQWRTRQVRVSTVREMWGLVTHHDANGVKIICVGNFTTDAELFAEGKAIELINGERLLELVRSVQTSPTTGGSEPLPSSASQTAPPSCLRCGAVMVKRANRKTAQEFWGCSKYPACRGTQPA